MSSLRFSVYTMLLLGIVLPSCTSSQTSRSYKPSNQEVVDRGYDYALEDDVNQSSKTMKQNEDKPSNLSLADMLRQTSGVIVTGQGNAVTVRISGISSFGSSDPLYVVNGTAVGTNYSQVAGTLNTNEITSITVLKGNDAAIYGSRGGNGVIVIRSK